jgi:hypothetical protein
VPTQARKGGEDGVLGRVHVATGHRNRTEPCDTRECPSVATGLAQAGQECMTQAVHANIKRSNATIRKSAAVRLTRIMFIPSLKDISSDGTPLHIGAEGGIMRVEELYASFS